MKKILFLLITLFLAPSSISWGLSLSEIRTEIRFHIKDSNTSRQKYSDTQLNNLINQGHREVVNIGYVIVKSTSITLTVGATHYAVPTDLMQIQRVTFKNENLPETSKVQLDGRFSGSSWLNESGYPSQYYQDATLGEYISIYPWPGSASSTGTLKVDYWAQANALSSDSDTPYDGENRMQSYSDILIWYVVYWIHMRDGLFEKAKDALQMYETRMQSMFDKLGDKPNYFPSFGGDRSR